MKSFLCILGVLAISSSSAYPVIYYGKGTYLPGFGVGNFNQNGLQPIGGPVVPSNQLEFPNCQIGGNQPVVYPTEHQRILFGPNIPTTPIATPSSEVLSHPLGPTDLIYPNIFKDSQYYHWKQNAQRHVTWQQRASGQTGLEQPNHVQSNLDNGFRQGWQNVGPGYLKVPVNSPIFQ